MKGSQGNPNLDVGLNCQLWVNVDAFSSPFKIGDWSPSKLVPCCEVSPLVFYAWLPFLWPFKIHILLWSIRTGPWWSVLISLSISDGSSAWKRVKMHHSVLQGRWQARCLCRKCNSIGSKPCFLLLIVSMELRKQNQRKKPGQVTAASCWCKMVYIKWVISSLLYIWLWKYESFSAWDSSMCFFFLCFTFAPRPVKSFWVSLERVISVVVISCLCVCLRCDVCCVLGLWKTWRLLQAHQSLNRSQPCETCSHFNWLHLFAVQMLGL